MTSSPIKQLLDTLPQIGRVEWIGIRPARGEAMVVLEEVRADTDTGLVGDRFGGAAAAPRQVTLIQQEHLGVIASCLNVTSVAPETLRRNVVISGINLLALKDKRFRIGEALLEHTGPCQPCSKMERALGAGGYNAMRGHGGITARILKDGLIRLGDTVSIWSG